VSIEAHIKLEERVHEKRGFLAKQMDILLMLKSKFKEQHSSHQ
jgi:hypothetical protein